MKVLILGLGNPILTDDGVGIKVAQKIGERRPDLEVVETSEAGLSLLDLISGYDKIVIIDSIVTGRGRPGEVYKIELSDLKPSWEIAFSHGVDLATALELGRKLGLEMPGEISIYAVEVRDVTTFGERCTEEVERSIPFIAEQILREEGL